MASFVRVRILVLKLFYHCPLVTGPIPELADDLLVIKKPLELPLTGIKRYSGHNRSTPGNDADTVFLRMLAPSVQLTLFVAGRCCIDNGPKLDRSISDSGVISC